VLVQRTALTLRELLEANIGAQAIITESGKNPYEATIVDLPARSAEEQAATNPPNSAERLPERGNLILLKTWEGVKVVALDHIQDVTFKGEHKSAVANEEFRSLLTLKLDWGKAAPGSSAKVGLFYLQKGVRWIPSYKVDIDGNGQAIAKLQATLLNELADLEDVSVNLVVGVPTFAFKDMGDPIALQQNLAQLSQYFQSDSSSRNSPLASQFSNAIMSQQIRAPGDVGLGSGELGPEIGDAGKNEDFFVFTAPHVTLRRGERMVLVIAEFTLPYKDIFTLDLPFTPPPEVRCNLNTEQQRELARLFSSPKVLHKIRLTNNSHYPLTTAPALIVKNGRLLAQAMTTYTPIGAKMDLTITTAVDFQIKKTEVETKRTPNAVQENGNWYSRIDLAGTITVIGHRGEPAQLEITRGVLGGADLANQEGKIEKLNVFENGEFSASGEYPSWWNWYGWPSWWSYFNGLARITWNLTLTPQQPAELKYEWHYFWR